MKTLRVTTASGGIYVIHEATAFGTGVMGRLAGGDLRVFTFSDTDTVEEV